MNTAAAIRKEKKIGNELWCIYFCAVAITISPSSKLKRCETARRVYEMVKK